MSQLREMLKSELIEKLEKHYVKDDVIEKVISQFQHEVGRFCVTRNATINYSDVNKTTSMILLPRDCMYATQAFQMEILSVRTSVRLSVYQTRGL